MSTYDSAIPGNRNDVYWHNHGMTRVSTPTTEADEHGSESNWEKKYFIIMDELTKEQERSKQDLAEVNSLRQNMLDMQIDASMNRLSDTQISDQSEALIDERDHYYKKWEKSEVMIQKIREVFSLRAGLESEKPMVAAKEHNLIKDLGDRVTGAVVWRGQSEDGAYNEFNEYNTGDCYEGDGDMDAGDMGEGDNTHVDDAWEPNRLTTTVKSEFEAESEELEEPVESSKPLCQRCATVCNTGGWC